jgi:NAD(P)-dependent dehydrogenase (short-subunit alcohol dehydrogenase family)
MHRDLRDGVVVVTGASSGIGRATALEFARAGARVVLAARRADALEELARECRDAGGEALAVPTDVTDEHAVQRLAQTAVDRFGRLDVWVNNAGVTLFARFEEAPPDAFRRVVETNLFGYVHGARAALPWFRKQGGGVLINNASVAGKTGAPYVSAYALTKFAVVGFSESLREELLDSGIEVCTILPASIDTPLFQHAANFTGRAVKPLAPVYDADMVAAAILRSAKRPRREVFVGNAGRRLALIRTLAPAFGERLMARKVERDHFQGHASPRSEGNLFAPTPGTGVSGGWRPATAALGQLLVGTLAVVGVGALAWMWLAGETPFAAGSASADVVTRGRRLMRAAG